MPRIPARRKAAVLALTLAFSLPWCASTAHPGARPVPSRATAPPLELLQNHALNWLRGAWAKAGCNINPNGLCATGKAPAAPRPVEIGCNIDPSGCHGS